jgi:hypothetical protein
MTKPMTKIAVMPSAYGQHMDEAYDKHEDDPDHRYCAKGEQIKSPPYPWRSHRSTHLSACDEPPPESRRDDRRREDDSERRPG